MVKMAKDSATKEPERAYAEELEEIIKTLRGTLFDEEMKDLDNVKRPKSEGMRDRAES